MWKFRTTYTVEPDAEVQASESNIAALAGSYESAELGATWVLEAVDADLLLRAHDHSGGS